MAIPFRIFIGLLFLVILSPARGLNDISQQDSSGALRQALTRVPPRRWPVWASRTASSATRVKILPENLQKAEKLMRKLGMGKHADELINTMNRAAEPPCRAKALLDAVNR